MIRLERVSLSDFERGMVVGARLSISKTADLLRFSRTTISMFTEFAEKGQKKRKYPVSGNCLDENALLMSEVSGEWADWLEMIERQQ